MIWTPKFQLARDGRQYQVFTLIGTGRGWRQKMYVTPALDKLVSVEVETLPTPEGWTLKANEHYVRIVSGGDVIVLPFSKRPYVRNDGSFQVLGQDYGHTETLLTHYGVHDGKCVIFAPKGTLHDLPSAAK